MSATGRRLTNDGTVDLDFTVHRRAFLAIIGTWSYRLTSSGEGGRRASRRGSRDGRVAMYRGRVLRRGLADYPARLARRFTEAAALVDGDLKGAYDSVAGLLLVRRRMSRRGFDLLVFGKLMIVRESAKSS